MNICVLKAHNGNFPRLRLSRVGTQQTIVTQDTLSRATSTEMNRDSRLGVLFESPVATAFATVIAVWDQIPKRDHTNDPFEQITTVNSVTGEAFDAEGTYILTLTTEGREHFRMLQEGPQIVPWVVSQTNMKNLGAVLHQHMPCDLRVACEYGPWQKLEFSHVESSRWVSNVFWDAQVQMVAEQLLSSTGRTMTPDELYAAITG